MEGIHAAGLLLYRLSGKQEHYSKPEFLLLHDNIAGHKHWTPPKGLILEGEDPLRAAIREVTELIGVDEIDLRVEPYHYQLQYLDNNRRKTVTYFLAQISQQAQATTDGAAVILSWCNVTNASEKVLYRSMQDIIKKAAEHIQQCMELRLSANETVMYVRPKDLSKKKPPVVGGLPDGVFPRPPNNGKDINIMLYKTRLCERFERDGVCPYEIKCMFAHGPSELREYVPQNYKTKLCQNYLSGKCQYGAKCVHAHGPEELRKPVHQQGHRGQDGMNSLERDMRMMQYPGPYPYPQPSYTNTALPPNPLPTTTVPTTTTTANEPPTMLFPSPAAGSSATVAPVPPPAPQMVTPTTSTPSTDSKKEKDLVAIHVPAVNVTAKKVRPQSSSDKAINAKEALVNVDAALETSRTWIVQISDEEKTKFMEAVDGKPGQQDKKDAIDQVVAELKKYFASHPLETDQFKEVTKKEIRHDLSKKQVLRVVLCCLFDDESTKNIIPKLKQKIEFLRKFVTVEEDQQVFLSAIDWYLRKNQHIEGLMKQFAKVLYDVDLVEEDAFLAWESTAANTSVLKQRLEPFFVWLRNAEEDSS